MKFTTINIYCVTQCLESIEADTYRQNQLQCNWVQCDTNAGESELKILCKEIEILENTENEQINSYIADSQHFTPPITILRRSISMPLR